MGYYMCRSCDNFFKTLHRVIPGCCPRCRDAYNLTMLQKQQYYDWVRIRDNSNLYRNLKLRGVIE